MYFYCWRVLGGSFGALSIHSKGLSCWLPQMWTVVIQEVNHMYKLNYFVSHICSQFISSCWERQVPRLSTKSISESQTFTWTIFRFTHIINKVFLPCLDGVVPVHLLIIDKISIFFLFITITDRNVWLSLTAMQKTWRDVS